VRNWVGLLKNDRRLFFAAAGKTSQAAAYFEVRANLAPARSRPPSSVTRLTSTRPSIMPPPGLCRAGR
jgi:hypothetical protein